MTAQALRQVGTDFLLGSYAVEAPAADEVLVTVSASGVNRADLLQRAGKYPAPPGAPSDVPGLEFSGIVASAGRDSGWHRGDRVMGVVAGGAHASQICVAGDQLMVVPPNMDLVAAAAVPEVFSAVLDAFDQGGLRSGHRLLVYAVASGIGTAAVQLARHLGAVTVGTSRSAAKLARLTELGMAPDVTVLDVGEWSVEPVDMVLDTLGGPYLTRAVASLRPRGRVVCLSTLAGARPEVPLGLLLAKRAHIIGSVLRSRSRAEKAELARQMNIRVVPGFAAGALRPVVDAVIPADQADQAFAAMAANQNVGKIVLTW